MCIHDKGQWPVLCHWPLIADYLGQWPVLGHWPLIADYLGQ
jgi:hypothetical protein